MWINRCVAENNTSSTAGEETWGCKLDLQVGLAYDTIQRPSG